MFSETNDILFCSNNTELPHINIDGQKIITVNYTKFQRVNIKYQIDHLIKKLSQYVGLFLQV